ncbi:MAG: cycloisomerase [Opitutus sp.]|nr:cycloisomerase [Opitutus sp.]
MRLTLLCFALLSATLAADKKISPPIGQLATPGWGYEELRRFPAPEARQGVAVDREFFYAIGNHELGRYRKATGERVANWTGPAGGEIIHLNAGIIFDGKLHGVHSNYPGVPMLSSLEIFDCATLKHIGTHSFGRMDGSFTWLDRKANRWLACFVHYGDRGAEPNRDGAWTQIIEFDDEWRRTAAWALPPDLIARFGGRGYSASGGAFGPGGHLYLTGHDNTELYVVDFPRAGSVMKWIATIPISAEGQAFCFDPTQPDMLYTVLKRTKEVIVGRVRLPAGGAR